MLHRHIADEARPLVVIDCPMPPSVNRLWRNRVGRSKPYISYRYAKWKRHFDSVIMATIPRPKMPGRFVASIILDERKRRHNSDADNRIKALLDALQRCEVIENDALATSVTVRWGPADGCRVYLYPDHSLRRAGDAA